MIKQILCIGWMALGFWVSVAAANDSVAALETGGLVLEKTDKIVMEREDLFISEDAIRVAYLFRNTSDKDIRTRVAFPVPEFPEEPESDIALDTHSRNPMNFSVQVNRKTQDFATEVKKRNGLVKITHHWMQTFPAGKTVSVKHNYHPAVGGEASFWFEGDVRAKRIARYCIEPDLQNWIARNNQMEKGLMLSPGFVDYILTTGANWKGPIGRFHLTLQKQKPEDKLSLCATGIKKADARTFVLEKTNFTPKQDLHVLFLHAYKLNDQ